MQSRTGHAARGGFPLEDIHAVLRDTPGIWEEMRGGRVLLLGGTGFVGRWLLESFLAANEAFSLKASAVVVTRSPERLATVAPHLSSEPAVQVLRGELTRGRFPDGPFTHVIHAATAEGYSAQAAQAEAMVRGAVRLTRFAVEHEATALLLVSSGAVYDRMGRGPARIAEEQAVFLDALAPGRFYGECRRFMEALCCEAARGSGLRVKIARGFGFIGPGMRMDGRFAVMDFISDALSGGPVVVGNTGRARRSLLYASDLATWLWTILFRGGAERPYNMGSEHGCTIAQIARLVAKSVGGQVPVVIQGNPEPAGGRIQYVPDTSRARLELGLHARVGIEEAVQKTLSFYASMSQSAA